MLLKGAVEEVAIGEIDSTVEETGRSRLKCVPEANGKGSRDAQETVLSPPSKRFSLGERRLILMQFNGIS